MNISTIVLITLVPPIVFGISDSLWKLPVLALGANQVIFLRNLITSTFLGTVVLIFGNQIDYSSITSLQYASVLVVCITSYFGLFFFNKAHQHGPIAVLIPICSSNCVVSFLLATILFNTTISSNKMIGLLLVIVGVLLISYWDYKKSVGSTRICIQYSFLAAFFWGVSYTFFQWCSQTVGVNYFSFILECTILVMTTLHLLVMRQRIEVIELYKQKKLTVLIGAIACCGAVGVYCGNLGFYQLGLYTMISIGAFAMLLPQLASKFIYKETFNPKKYIAIACIMTGLIFNYYLA
jgi:Predicted membrane protein